MGWRPAPPTPPEMRIVYAGAGGSHKLVIDTGDGIKGEITGFDDITEAALVSEAILTALYGGEGY